MSLRAAAYCRSQDSDLCAQEETIRAYCQTHGLTLTRIYRDPQTSALHLRRRGLTALFDDAQNGYFEVVVACDTSRLSRRLHDLYQIQNRLKKAGVALRLCSDDRQGAFQDENGTPKPYCSDPSKR